jgi:hypothetical protein
MEPGDEEWIPAEPTAGARPDKGQPETDPPDEDWPQGPAGPRERGGVSGSLGFSWWVAALVAIVAAAAGVAVALLIMPGHR